VVEGILAETIAQVYHSLNAYKEHTEDETLSTMTLPQHLQAVIGVACIEFVKLHDLLSNQNRATYTKKHRAVYDLVSVAQPLFADISPDDHTGEDNDPETARHVKLITDTLATMHRLMREDATPAFRKHVLRVYKEQYAPAPS
jgi:hypothetical protein